MARLPRENASNHTEYVPIYLAGSSSKREYTQIHGLLPYGVWRTLPPLPSGATRTHPCVRKHVDDVRLPHSKWQGNLYPTPNSLERGFSKPRYISMHACGGSHPGIWALKPKHQSDFADMHHVTKAVWPGSTFSSAHTCSPRAVPNVQTCCTPTAVVLHPAWQYTPAVHR